MFQWINNIKWFIQRGRRGYADCDVWWLCTYLSEWLPKALRQLAKETHGAPNDLFDGTGERWEKVLETMAQGFEARNIIDENLPEKEEEERLERIANKGLLLFVKYFKDLWD